MRTVPTLWKANAIVFMSSFCVMVIELIASRILAPYIGVSLYTWTSIIGIILAGIALGNYLGGKIADRRPSPLVLAATFFVGSLATVAILPATAVVTSADWFDSLPVMWNFTLKTFSIFFLPAVILSMVSPMVIKLTLADLGQTGGVVGTIYAYSTAGSILGTFMTGFFFILWFGTHMIVWLAAATLMATGVIAYISWRIPGRWRLSFKNLLTWTTAIVIVAISLVLFQARESWEESYTRESNYYAINVFDVGDNVKVLYLDNFDQGYTIPNQPTILIYAYLKVFKEIVGYLAQKNPAPRILHLGGGAYCFPRYMERVYPESINEVVEIDPMVTEVVHEELGLRRDTIIKTFNQDARRFLIRRKRSISTQSCGQCVDDENYNVHGCPLTYSPVIHDLCPLAEGFNPAIPLIPASLAGEISGPYGVPPAPEPVSFWHLPWPDAEQQVSGLSRPGLRPDFAAAFEAPDRLFHLRSVKGRNSERARMSEIPYPAYYASPGTGSHR